MNAEELLEKRRAQDRARQARYYEKNKEKLALKRQELNPVTAPKEAPLTALENVVFIPFLENSELTPHTKKKYIGDTIRLLGLLKEKGLKQAVDNGSIKPLIMESVFSQRTKLQMAAVTLKLLNGTNQKLTPKTFKEFKQFIELLKQSTEPAQNELKNQVVMKWTVYMKAIIAKYGVDSKMGMIVSLYNELPVRDDFQLKIVTKTPADPVENYIVIGDSMRKARVVISKYKTERTYGMINEILTQKLTTQIKKYIQSNKLQGGDYLLGNEQLSGYVIYKNKGILDGGFTAFRHMKITELNDTLTPEAMIQLADKMKHSPLIQKSYIQQL